MVEQTKLRKSCSVTLKGRENLIADGVKCIVSFDDGFIKLNTELGILNVEGTNMVIDELTKKDGIVYVNGCIDGFYYSKDKQKKSAFGGKK